MGGSGVLLLLASCVVLAHLAAATAAERPLKDVCDLEPEAMVRVLGCINQTANGDVGLIISKFKSNDAFLTRALCGAGFDIDDFMEELMMAEKKCLKDVL